MPVEASKTNSAAAKTIKKSSNGHCRMRDTWEVYGNSVYSFRVDNRRSVNWGFSVL